MDFLLKIVEGPMKGAELALVGGTTVSFGSGSESDIVVADPALAPLAAKLEVTDAGVTVHAADGKVTALAPFTVMRFGDTAIAVGPSTGKWEKLSEPKADEASASSPAKAETGKGDEAEASSTASRSDRGHSLLWIVLGVLVLVLILVALWLFCAPANSFVLKAREQAVGLFRDPPPPPPQKLPTLAEIASEHDLVYADGKLSGNLARRTERLAIRALALAVDPAVKFDLTDDETLRTAAGELLFACSDGQLYVISASNRVVVIGGFAPSAQSLTTSLRALNTDVKDVAKVDTARVQVGGTPPAQMIPTATGVELVPAETAVAARPETPVRTRPDYPIAGILTTPYPCVVMRNGMRLVEGAQVGTATLVKIEAEKLTLKEGGSEFTWEP